MLRENQVTTDAQTDDGVDLRVAAVELRGLARRVAGNVTGTGRNLLPRDLAATDLAADRRDVKKAPKQVGEDLGLPVKLDTERDPHTLVSHAVAKVNEFRNTTQSSLGLARYVDGHLK